MNGALYEHELDEDIKKEAADLAKPQCHNRDWFKRIDRILKKVSRLENNLNIEKIGETMVCSLRTIASGKKDYGENISDTDYSECRKIAKDTLREVGCFND